MSIDPRRIEVMDDKVAEILRQKSPAARLAIAAGMWRSARHMIHATVSQQHPDWSEEQINREVVRRLSHGAR
jgi:Rv0078B-related antitoxin